MIIRQSTRAALALKHVNPTHLWERILRTAVTCNEYPTTLRIRVLMDLNAEDHNDLLLLAGELSSIAYEDHTVHYRMHQLSALIRKYPGLKLKDVNPEVAALTVFNNAEWRCKWSNRKFALISRHGLGKEAPALLAMQKYIAFVLRNRSDRDEDGPCPTPNMESIFAKCSFTGGASLGVHGNNTSLLRKLAQGERLELTCNPNALQLAAEAVWNHFQMREFFLNLDCREKGIVEEHYDFVCHDKRTFVRKFLQSVQLVCHNKVAFVLKDASVSRTIAAEPTLSTFVLKGIDLEMRDLLLRAGLDLSDQEPNCQMAFEGSRDWQEDDPYCTIDLKSASAMLCRNLIKYVLPPKWFDLLDQCRSSFYELPDGTRHRYEQFTSMGNGSCFPLQTLIFASVCHAAYAERSEAPDFRVYGDDIIVRKRVFDRVISLLKFLGLKPNPKKTFSEGPFRESCGADWHSAINVRPVFLDHALETPAQIFGFHNQSLRRQGMVDLYFREIRELLFNEVPAPARLVIDHDPRGSDAPDNKTIDGAFWVPHDVVMTSPLCFYNKQTFSWTYTVCQAVAVADPLDGLSQELGGVSALTYGQALYMAALSGSSSVKTFTTRYTTRHRAVLVNRPVRWKDSDLPAFWSRPEVLGPPSPPRVRGERFQYLASKYR